MLIIRDAANCPESAQGAVIALGNFDGLHTGHQAIITRAKSIAQELHAPAAVMTFEPHPREFFARNTNKLRIYPLHQKLTMLKQMGIDVLFLQRFNQNLASTSAHNFMTQILNKQLKAQHVVTGFNFAFGKGREGSTDTLALHAKQSGFGFTACTPVRISEDLVISSSAIRSLLAEGNMAGARNLLGHHYHLSGRVSAGLQNGRGLGFPTANLHLNALFKPRFGVYAIRCQVSGDDTWYDGVANIGIKPTFNATDPLLEVHLFDFDQELYHKRINVTFYQFIRPEERFNSLEDLKTQIHKDVDSAKQILQDQPRS